MRHREIFGQRMTFVEPICGRVMHHLDAAGGTSATFSVTRHDAMLSWSVTDGSLAFRSALCRIHE
jgi:hypothetical protein